MVDALRPAADALKAGLDSGKPLEEAWRTAVEAAIVGADATKTMRPRLGRASYLGERAVGYPDGGAVAAATWLKALMP